MSKDLNRWQGIGRLGKDVDLRHLANGDAAANFSMACNDDYKTKDGEKVERTEWVTVSAFGRLAEVCGQYLSKGSRIYAEGKLTTRKWQDKEGRDRYTTEVRLENMQMLDGKPREDDQRGGYAGSSRASVNEPRRQQAPAPASNGGGFSDDDLDSIPF